uniref:Uncharacterized protein n=1 Tax=Kalanchoe fedtschenkoi TaxID=63787 RepID=A0A7N0UHF0_KALFE
MNRESSKYGGGPKELTGALDLIDHFKLVRYHEFFCKTSIPSSVSKAHYLSNVVGATDISKGDGMQLSQLVQNIMSSAEKREHIQVFDLDNLSEAFKFRGPCVLPRGVQGISSVLGLSKLESKDKEKNNKKIGVLIKEKDQGSNHKHRSKHMGKNKKVKSSHKDATTEVKLLKKKRNHDVEENHNGFPRQKIK